jgi:hypothetical protein
MLLEQQTEIDVSAARIETSQQVATMLIVTSPMPVPYQKPKDISWDDMRFPDQEAVLREAHEMRRAMRARLVPLSVTDSGQIHVNELAMLPKREYSIQLGDGTYQFVKGDDGVVVMYEVI